MIQLIHPQIVKHCVHFFLTPNEMLFQVYMVQWHVLKIYTAHVFCTNTFSFSPIAMFQTYDFGHQLSSGQQHNIKEEEEEEEQEEEEEEEEQEAYLTKRR